MAELTTDQIGFYKTLYSFIKEPVVNDLLVKYAKNYYDIAIKQLATATDLIEIGRLQGEIKALERFIYIKDNVTKIMNNIRV